jgi:hypothetical protein
MIEDQLDGSKAWSITLLESGIEFLWAGAHGQRVLFFRSQMGLPYSRSRYKMTYVEHR